MLELTVDGIDRLPPGRTLDNAIGEVILGWKPHPLDPKPAPACSTEEALADKMLALLQPKLPPGHGLHEHPLRLGVRVALVDEQRGEPAIEVEGRTRAHALCRFALHLALRYPEIRKDA
jgi:hypothetical protein